MTTRKKNALQVLFVILTIVLIFHLMVLLEIIPFEFVWAGKLQSVKEMRQFETVSIVLNTLMLSVFVVKYRLLRKGAKNRAIDLFIWGFIVLFILNTVGNLFAKNLLELIFGCLLTSFSALLCFMVVRK